MTNKKNKIETNVSSVYPDAQHSDCGCGCDSCHCGDDCQCGCHSSDNQMFHMRFLQTLTLILSIIVLTGLVWVIHDDAPKTRRTAAERRIANRASESAIRDFIMRNPKVLIDSVENYYRKQQAKNARPVADEKAPADLVSKIVADKTNHSMGNAKGKYVIIEFFDYNCGWCKRTNQAIGEAIKKKEASNIRWILIDTPIFGEASETISRYVLAAGEQGKFKEMHKAVVASDKRLTEESLISMAKKLKLDTKKLKKDAKGKKVKDKLAENRKYAEKLNINGVPMLIVDGKIHHGALFGEELDKAVKESSKK